MNNDNNIQIESSWKNALRAEFTQAYFQDMVKYLKFEKEKGKKIYPAGPLIFNAFQLTPFDKVKVIILGQDPYHNPGEAMGLSFSVPLGTRIPPSLKNIYKELERDMGISPPDHGDLTSWAQQGVFMLNAMLTVEHKSPGSHKNIGWQNFTDAVIRELSAKREHLVFLLWGKFAQSKKVLIDEQKHTVLEAAHPSPLARNAYAGCMHFSKTNKILKNHNIPQINWEIK